MGKWLKKCFRYETSLSGTLNTINSIGTKHPLGKMRMSSTAWKHSSQRLKFWSCLLTEVDTSLFFPYLRISPHNLTVHKMLLKIAHIDGRIETHFLQCVIPKEELNR